MLIMKNKKKICYSKRVMRNIKILQCKAVVMQ